MTAALPALAPGLRQDARGSAWDDLQAKLDAIADGLAPDLLGVFASLDKFSKLEMSRVLGLDLRADPRLLYQSQSFVRKNVALIKSVGQEQLGIMQGVVDQAVGAQLSYSALSLQIQERFGVVESRANLIARDQILTANSQLSQARAESVGVTGYTWSTSKDERVRHDHQVLDGLKFTYANPPVVDQRTGARAQPGTYFQCRCIAIPDTDALLFGP